MEENNIAVEKKISISAAETDVEKKISISSAETQKKISISSAETQFVLFTVFTLRNGNCLQIRDIEEDYGGKVTLGCVKAVRPNDDFLPVLDFGDTITLYGNLYTVKGLNTTSWSDKTKVFLYKLDTE